MERKIFHGTVRPFDIAQALLGEFNRGNLRAQTLGQGEKMAVQIGSRPDARSGGQTATTVTLQGMEDGVIVEVGQQAWLGIAASLGATALTALRNPLNLLGRLDDLAQDIEHLQLNERIWQVVGEAVQSAGASMELSSKLKRSNCEYCNTPNPVGAPVCEACGAPMGNVQPQPCKHCGNVLNPGSEICPNCNQPT